MSQTSLWQTNQQNIDFSELCNALYERELRMLANTESASIKSIQGRLKSLPYYINRTAILMVQVKTQGITPLELDIQNASWSAKQANKLSLSGQTKQAVLSWYLTKKIPVGLVVPILNDNHIILDCIDRVDVINKRLRTNIAGWFSLIEGEHNCDEKSHQTHSLKLLKPNKKLMLAACAGHCWQKSISENASDTANLNNFTGSTVKLRPIIPSLRELLLSCAINWKDFKQPLAI
ncbi:hypothetical protein L3081_07640 [Colwellia sp. MSW7]|uniref:Uncharacterized protein n=1 Tax=Colwellia maritima TaxID=2912588 RepID=A0ABS9WZE6_9GAMM|nr:hypothetical protein [Colwellia maritima]MCI2283300.1 hypothetical protein [Colwellia maritima]